MCPGSIDPFYRVTYYIKWVTTSWTDGSNGTINKLSQERIWGQIKKERDRQIT